MSKYFENISMILAASTQDVIGNTITDKQYSQIKQMLPNEKPPEPFASSINTKSIADIIDRADSLQSKAYEMPKQSATLSNQQSLDATIGSAPTAESTINQASK